MVPPPAKTTDGQDRFRTVGQYPDEQGHLNSRPSPAFRPFHLSKASPRGPVAGKIVSFLFKIPLPVRRFARFCLRSALER